MALLTAIRGRPRLLISLTVATAAWFLLPAAWPVTARMLLAWDAGSLLYLILAWTMFARSSPEDLHRRASAEDEGALVILVLTIVAAVFSLVAIGAELSGIHSAGADRAPRVSLAVGTIVCSWFFLHTIFAIHYAHVDYDEKARAWPLNFPGDESPDYWDFLYFSFNLGAAAQTSDVAITKGSLRRVVLAHTVLSFLFNTTVLALAVNVGAGLL